MKAPEQYLPVVLFILPYKVVLIKATERYFPVMLFIMLYKLALTFESVSKILKCGHCSTTFLSYFPVALLVLQYFPWQVMEFGIFFF